MAQPEYDVFIAGSGPTAATYARLVLEHDPNVRVLMVEVGSQDSPTIGMNLKNAVKYQRDLDAFMHIIRASCQPVSLAPAGGFLPEVLGDVWSQPGNRSSIRSPYNPNQDPTLNLVGASITRAVGGMVTHWTCACPEPHDEELVESPIPRPAMRKLLRYGKELLNVHEDQFENSVRHKLVMKALSDAFGARQGITVKSLPIAGERSKENEALFNWSGVDTILGDFIHAKDAQGRNRFKLGDTTETVAHYLLHCPRYALERRTLLESRGHEFVRLDFLLFSSEALGPLFNLVKATGRFTDLLR